MEKIMRNFIKSFFPSVYNAIRAEGYEAAIKDILVFKDKIYTGSVTLETGTALIQNCTFLGSEKGLILKTLQ